MAFAALIAGDSGLQSFTEGIDIISDNITNVNTVGYKETRARFVTLVTETQSVSRYSPGGVQAVADTLISRQGVLQPSSSSTDLGIDGAGFFTVRAGADAADQNAETLFTRAGSFAPNRDGFLQNTAGYFLLGYPLDQQGNIINNLTDINALEPVNIGQFTGTAEATTEVDLRVNLQASSPTAGTGGLPAYAVGDIANGTVTATTQPSFFERSIRVFDSLGGSHTVNLGAVKTGVNEWSVELYVDPPAYVDAAVLGNPDGRIAAGTLAFNSDGSIDLAASTLEAAQPISVPWTNGSDVGSIDFNLGDDGALNGFTQFDDPSELISRAVDGALYGNIVGTNVSQDGIVTAIFDNGLQRDIFQIPSALFPNPDGLQRREGNAFQQTDFSGLFNLVIPGTASAGVVVGSALEGSTVDLANEFADLIRTQRAFSASARIVTTADEVLEELVRI